MSTAAEEGGGSQGGHASLASRGRHLSSEFVSPRSSMLLSGSSVSHNIVVDDLSDFASDREPPLTSGQSSGHRKLAAMTASAMPSSKGDQASASSSLSRDRAEPQRRSHVPMMTSDSIDQSVTSSLARAPASPRPAVGSLGLPLGPPLSNLEIPGHN